MPSSEYAASSTRVVSRLEARQSFSRISSQPGRSPVKACADRPVASSISEMISGDCLWLGISKFMYGVQSSV